MIFILGVICGLLVSVLFVATSVFLTTTRRFTPETILDTLKLKKTAQKGEIITLPDEETEAREKYIREKHAQGQDVFLDEL